MTGFTAIPALGGGVRRKNDLGALCATEGVSVSCLVHTKSSYRTTRGGAMTEWILWARDWPEVVTPLAMLAVGLLWVAANALVWRLVK
jgi:hypothetical protein